MLSLDRAAYLPYVMLMYIFRSTRADSTCSLSVVRTLCMVWFYFMTSVFKFLFSLWNLRLTNVWTFLVNYSTRALMTSGRGVEDKPWGVSSIYKKKTQTGTRWFLRTYRSQMNNYWEMIDSSAVCTFGRLYHLTFKHQRNCMSIRLKWFLLMRLCFIYRKS